MADYNTSAVELGMGRVSAPLKPRNFDEDFAESVGYRDASARGATPNEAMISGIRAKQEIKDPMFQFRKLQLQTQVSAYAAQLAQSEFSRQIKQKQIDDETADSKSAAEIIQKFGGDNDKTIEALNTTFWKSPRGIQNASQWRIQISSLKSRDAATKAISKLSPQGLAFVSQFDQGSYDWWKAVDETSKSEAVSAANLRSQSFSPSRQRKLLDEAIEAESVGNLEEAEILRDAARRVQSIKKTAPIQNAEEYGRLIYLAANEPDPEAKALLIDQAQIIRGQKPGTESTSTTIRQVPHPDGGTNAPTTLTNVTRRVSGPKSEAAAETREHVASMGGKRMVDDAANPPAANAPTSKIVIQNGQRFQVNADGTSTHLGPTQ